ncbi:hypothetical protein, partial [Bacillus subtilis]
PCPKEFHRSVALVKDYSKKMDVNYLYSNVFVFLLMSKNKKAENSVKIYATLVIKISKFIDFLLKVHASVLSLNSPKISYYIIKTKQRQHRQFFRKTNFLFIF